MGPGTLVFILVIVLLALLLGLFAHPLFFLILLALLALFVV